MAGTKMKTQATSRIYKGPMRHPKLHKNATDSVEEVWAPSITARESELRALTKKPPKSEVETTLLVSEKDQVKFKTGSRYKGGWNTLGMAGHGKYTMFHSVEYNGELDDGKFHGKGVMWYPNNSRVEGIWRKGRNVERKYYFNDGLIFDEKNWTYCLHPDRRFKMEYKAGIRATGRTLLANRIPPRPIPPGCYDVGDGFYSPITKCVTHPSTGRILRIPPRSEEKWILENCRKSTGLCMFQPEKEQHAFDEEEEEHELEDSLIKITAAERLPEQESVEDEEPKMVDKSTGRFDILHKKVQQRAYNTKYIFVDEMRSRACKKHRLYLPALKVKNKVSILPDLRVIPPFRCIHDSKAQLSNKMVLLLSMLKECDKLGGIRMVNPTTLKRYKKNFKLLLQEEKRARESVQLCLSDISRTSENKDVSRTSDLMGNTSINSSQRKTKVFAFKEGDDRRSVYRAWEHKAIRAKELASIPKKSLDGYGFEESASFQGPQSSEEFEKDFLKESYTKKEKAKDCDVCLANEQSKIDALRRLEKIGKLIAESEKEELRRKQEAETLITGGKEDKIKAQEFAALLSESNQTLVDVIARSNIDTEKVMLFLQNERSFQEDDFENVDEDTGAAMQEVGNLEMDKRESSIATINNDETQIKALEKTSDLNKSVSKTDKPLELVFDTGTSNDSENDTTKTDTTATPRSNATDVSSDIPEILDFETNEMPDSSSSSRPVTPLSDLTTIESDYGETETEG